MSRHVKQHHDTIPNTMPVIDTYTPRAERLSDPVHMRIERADRSALDKLHMEIQSVLPFDKQALLREAITLGLPLVSKKYHGLIATINQSKK